MRRHHGLLGNIADKVTRHKELKHASRLQDDIARGDLLAAEYHASKVDTYSDLNAQLNGPRGGGFSSIVPVHTTSTVIEQVPTATNTYHQETTTVTSPMARTSYDAGYRHESRNVTSNANGNYYHSESKKVRSPTGVHTESHKIVDQRNPSPVMYAGSSGFESQVRHQEEIRQNVQSPIMQSRELRNANYVQHTETRNVLESPVSPYMPSNNQTTVHTESRHQDSQKNFINPFMSPMERERRQTNIIETQQATTHSNTFSPGEKMHSETIKEDSYFSRNSGINNIRGLNNDTHKVIHREEHHTEEHGRY